MEAVWFDVPSEIHSPSLVFLVQILSLSSGLIIGYASVPVPPLASVRAPRSSGSNAIVNSVMADVIHQPDTLATAAAFVPPVDTGSALTRAMDVAAAVASPGTPTTPSADAPRLRSHSQAFGAVTPPPGETADRCGRLTAETLGCVPAEADAAAEGFGGAARRHSALALATHPAVAGPLCDWVVSIQVRCAGYEAVRACLTSCVRLFFSCRM
jgi:hypothetical protein